MLIVLFVAFAVAIAIAVFFRCLPLWVRVNATGRDRAGQGGVIEHASATAPRGFQAADGHRQDPEAPGACGDGVGTEGM